MPLRDPPPPGLVKHHAENTDDEKASANSSANDIVVVTCCLYAVPESAGGVGDVQHKGEELDDADDDGDDDCQESEHDGVVQEGDGVAVVLGRFDLMVLAEDQGRLGRGAVAFGREEVGGGLDIE